MPDLSFRWMLVAGVALFAGACGPGRDRDRAAPGVMPSSTTTTASTTTTTAAPAEGSFAMRWTGPFEVRLPNGWRIGDCEGDRPNVCVSDGDRFLGDIELAAGFPLGEQDRGKDRAAVASRWAAEMIAEFQTDRAKGCPAFAFRPDRVADVTVGGQPGARGGFTLVDGSGRVVERVINHYVAGAEEMAIVNTDAYVSEGGCLPPSEDDPSFTPADLAALEPYLDRLVAETPASARG